MDDLIKKYRVLLTLPVAVALTMFSVEFIAERTLLIESRYEIYKYIAVILITTMFFIISTRDLLRKQSVAYNVGIIGYPYSGKTTMITTLFAAIMYSRVNLKNYKATLKGSSTIERVNDNLGKLEKGIPIGSTNDQTMFAFRFNIESKSKLFPSEYKIELGDFPGEASQSLINKENNLWIFDSDYFKWVKDSDSFIFTIDLGRVVVEGDSYVAEISKSIRAAWQTIIEYNESVRDKLEKYPVALVFTKTDLYPFFFMEKYDKNAIYELAFSRDDLPKTNADYSDKDLELFKENILSKFENLLRFFATTSKRTKPVFISSFLEKNGYKYGIEELANHILP